MAAKEKEKQHNKHSNSGKFVSNKETEQKCGLVNKKILNQFFLVFADLLRKEKQSTFLLIPEKWIKNIFPACLKFISHLLITFNLVF